MAVVLYFCLAGSVAEAMVQAPFASAQDPYLIYWKADSLLSGNQDLHADALFREVQDIFLQEGDQRYYISCLIKRSRIAMRHVKIEEAKKLLDQADVSLSELDPDPQDSLYSNLFYRRAYYFQLLNDYDAALHYYYKSAEIREHIGHVDYILSIIYNNIGVLKNEMGDPSSAAQWFRKTIQTRTGLLGGDHVQLARPLSNLGGIQVMLGHYEDAEDHLLRARNLLENQEVINYSEMANVDNNLGNLALRMGDHLSAEQYYENALRIFNAATGVHQDKVSFTMNNLGLVYTLQERYKEALDLYYRNLDFQETYGIRPYGHTYSKMANLYHRMGASGDAETYYLKTIEDLTEAYGPDHPVMAAHYLNLGVFYSEQHDFMASDSLYRKALAIYIHTYGARHPETSRAYYNLAWLKKETGATDTALMYVQRSIISNTPDFSATDLAMNPDSTHCFSNLRLLASLKLKSELLAIKYFEYQTDTLFLTQAFHCLESAIVVIERMRFDYQTEESKLFLAGHEKETYTQYMQLALSLLDLTGNPEYKNKIFTVSEKSKAAVLLAGVRSTEAIQFGGIPDRLLATENEIRNELNYYQEELFEEKRLQSPDSARISLYEQYVFQLSYRYDSLISFFERNYPAYYELKYDPSTISIAEVQRSLRNDDVLIEYAVLDSSVVILALGKDFYKTIRVPLEIDLNQLITELQNLVSQDRFSDKAQEYYDRFIDISTTLHAILIGPVRPYIEKRNLIIIPDELLAMVPFDLLITAAPPVAIPRYDELPYLIRSHNLGYSYSATLHFNHSGGRKGRRTKLLAIAPDYDLEGRPFPEDDPVLNLRNTLMPLPYAKTEAMGIHRIYGGQVRIGPEATESFFKEAAGGYDVLHLAMHTIIDETDPMYSKLAFSMDPDLTGEDGFLNVREIYNLDLNAWLTVLSSCRSGAGKVRLGEGIMSIARSFLYAGSPSIVMTLWEVDDRSGSDIMQTFYAYLKRGHSIDKALRKAKLDYLDQAGMLRSHPYFWSGYISIGHRSGVSAFPSNAMIIGLALCLAGIVLWVYFIRKRSVKIH
jgi:CHAT domain-containing protein/Tfp pilus assembly protein PilF